MMRKSPSLHLLCVGRGTLPTFKFSFTLFETTPRRILLFAFFSLFLCVSFSLFSSHNSIYANHLSVNYSSLPPIHPTRLASSSFQDFIFIHTQSVLLPDWQVLVIVSPETDSQLLSCGNFICVYPNNATAPATFSGILPSTNQTTFKCLLPRSTRRRLPFAAPILSDKESPVPWLYSPPQQELIRWTYLVYESFSTEDDVVLFVKGLNNRQGLNRSPREFKCVFFVEEANNDSGTVKTTVTSSIQEVFRCGHPDLTAFGSIDEHDHDHNPIKLKLSVEETTATGAKKVVPSVAYYTPRRKRAKSQPKSLLCASTMVYNVGKFLREWIMYHSKIGVEKFILYDNDSDDDLISIVKNLNEEGYNVETLLWLWPKTQEAGFSHAALYAKDSCKWMIYIDIDEFIFAPSWDNSSQPSDQMLKSLLPPSSTSRRHMIGEVWIMCNEFGPSNQRSHPAEGVIQGYTCRRRLENRHKSIVLLEAIDDSLLNVIHHFSLNKCYRMKQLSLEVAVVNHYKYQAWAEFKAKFRRRVSAYVVDWMSSLNPLSKDRTPGLGYEAVEPRGWENKFCEVRDDRLKMLTRRWFGKQMGSRGTYRMAWQS
ncbi:glycosyltransferase family 92 protein RCOM_0530710 [Manihot esculenta]|uniref:Glycosyltransferase family 92 protein n=1 Tax=Manihot esculenta TaxID=3983 RepID=A0A2C9U044_MANES|nr:glycosyltransferase family 92 protein RCOM_0530710 [Manihot esculenta]